MARRAKGGARGPKAQELPETPTLLLQTEQGRLRAGLGFGVCTTPLTDGACFEDHLPPNYVAMCLRMQE